MVIRVVKQVECKVEKIYILDDELVENLDNLEEDEIEEFIIENDGELETENIIDVQSEKIISIETEKKFICFE